MHNKALSRTVGGQASVLVPVAGDEQAAGDRVEAQVESGDSGGDVGVDAERVGIECMHGEHVPMRPVALRRRGATQVLGPVVVAGPEGPGTQPPAARRPRVVLSAGASGTVL